VVIQNRKGTTMITLLISIFVQIALVLVMVIGGALMLKEVCQVGEEDIQRGFQAIYTKSKLLLRLLWV
jgi:hypothetical protein